MTDKELLQYKAALELAEEITSLVLYGGYDGECMGDEFEPVMTLIIKYAAVKHNVESQATNEKCN